MDYINGLWIVKGCLNNLLKKIITPKGLPFAL